MIPEIKKILYATDLSKNSSYAFYYAIHMARRFEAKITLLHAIEPIPAYVEVYVPSVAERIENRDRGEAIENIQGHLHQFCERVEAQVGDPCLVLVSKILVRVGNPVEEILRAAEEEECDLIILGSHGKGFLIQTFLGSVSRSVLDRTRKAVFIIPLPSEKTDINWERI